MRMSRSGLIAHGQNEFVVIRFDAWLLVDWNVSHRGSDADCLLSSGFQVEDSALTKWMLF